MRNLVLIFLRFGHIILFFLLEIFCLYLIVNYNRRQKEIWANSANIFMGYSSEKWNDWSNYFSLREKMDGLALENARLKEQLIEAGLKPTIEKDSSNTDSLRYHLLSAKVINNSTNKPNNTITLDKGIKDGVQRDMGVIGNSGIIGIISNVSENYAVANSILHRRSSISASIKRTGAFGGLKWVGSNPKYVNLTAIENYQIVQVGDTVVTSGYSTHFPPGIMIGVVEEAELPSGSSFHDIKVKLVNDFGSLRYVEIIKNINQQQQLELEREVTNE